MIKMTSHFTIFKSKIISSKEIKRFLPVALGLLISCATISLFSRLIVVGLAQVCQSSAVDNLSRFSNMTRDANGFLHITVNYSGGAGRTT